MKSGVFFRLDEKDRKALNYLLKQRATDTSTLLRRLLRNAAIIEAAMHQHGEEEQEILALFSRQSLKFPAQGKAW